MKHFTIAFLSVFVFSQVSAQNNDKGCTLRGIFSVSYSNSYTDNVFGCDMFEGGSCKEKDTLSVDISNDSELFIGWSYLDEVYFRHYDTVQWFYNDQLLDIDRYYYHDTVKSGCSMRWSANSHISGELDTGYYELRHLGVGDYIYSSGFPVIHVYKKEKEVTKNEIESTDIYPNPFNNIVNVDLEKTVEDASLIIYNMMGQEVERIHFSGSKHYEYSFDSLKTGVYVFAIYDNLLDTLIYRRKMQKL